MPLSRQVVPVDQAVRESFAQPRLRAAAFDRREPVTRRAAALETVARADWSEQRPEVAPESGTHRRKLPARPDRGRAHPGARAGGSAHSPGCSVRLRRTAVRPGDGAGIRGPAGPQADGMLIEAAGSRKPCGEQASTLLNGPKRPLRGSRRNRRNETLMPGWRTSNSEPLPPSLSLNRRATHDTGNPRGSKPDLWALRR